jgi:hypothetical protein
MVAQADPLVHVDATLMSEKEMELSGTPRALASACTAAVKLVPVRALMLL